MVKITAIIAMMLVSCSLWAVELTLTTKNVIQQDGEYTLEQSTESGYGHIRFKMEQPFQPGKILSFEYRTDNPKDLYYVATNLLVDKKGTYNSFPASSEWTKAELFFDNLVYTKSQGNPAEGEVFTGLNIYCRRLDKVKQGDIRLQVRNIRIEDDPNYDPALNCRLMTKEVAKNGEVYTLDQTKAERFGNIFFLVNETYDPGKRLVFEYRVKNPEQFGYIAVTFRTNELGTFNGLAPKAEWTKAELPFSALKTTKWVDKKRVALTEKDRFQRLQIYARIPDDKPAAPIFFELRNVRIEMPAKTDAAK